MSSVSGVRTPRERRSALRSLLRKRRQRELASKVASTVNGATSANNHGEPPSPADARPRLTLHDLHDIFREHPELELKYLNMMKMAITGKESICLPFNFHSHRQHTCLDISPYGNEQVSRIACTLCEDNRILPTGFDAMVAFINQTSNIMKNRNFYYGFCKSSELLKLSTNQPPIFQIYYLLHAANHDIVPFMHAEDGRLDMHVIFENPDVHIPCDCITQMLTAAREDYSVTLNIVRDHVVISVLCHAVSASSVKIDVTILQRKIDEMDIPNDVSESFERYKELIQELCQSSGNNLYEEATSSYAIRSPLTASPLHVVSTNGCGPSSSSQSTPPHLHPPSQATQPHHYSHHQSQSQQHHHRRQSPPPPLFLNSIRAP
uniref:UL53 protein n=1 Tax=Human cytomegalovirus TaxID=10359 RepID=Q9IHY8_HCMV|nr:UL53 protein [Human betaherpesvirus 5]